MVLRLSLAALLLSTTAAFAQDIPNHAVPVGGGPGFVGWKYVGPCPTGQVLGWNSPTADPVCLTGGGGGGAGVSSINSITGPINLVAGTNMTIVPGSPNAQSITLNAAGGGGGGSDPCPLLNLTGDVRSTNSCVTTLATVNSTPGTIGTANSINVLTVNAKGLVTAVVPTPISIPFNQMTGTLGCAQMPIITGDVTAGGGTCNLVISAGAVSNSKLANIPAASLKGNPTNAAGVPVDFKLTDLPNKPVPTPSTDSMLIYDSTAGTLKYCLLNQCISGGGTAGVTSLNLLSGALNLSGAGGITITPSGANIQIGLTPTTNPTTTFLVTAGSGTYTVPAGVVRIEVQAIAAGGGGQGGGTTPGGGVSGGNTTFGTSITVNGGTNGAGGGYGGGVSGCAGGYAVSGGGGDGGSLSLSGQFNGKGGMGGGSFWGGGGAGNYNTGGINGGAYGAGGGGGSAGSAATALGGQGGGAGGYCFLNIRSGLAASYSYTVGAGGTAGAAGTGGGTPGGTGAQGSIVIKEYYAAQGGSGGGGGTAGVTTLNTLLGDLSIVAGSGITVSQAGSTITITNSAAAPTVFTTGDLKPTVKTVADTGWVMLTDGGTISDSGGGGTVHASPAAQALFYLLWSACASYCQVHPSRGSDAPSDWAAKKSIDLPQGAGRAVGVAGQATSFSFTNRPLTSYRGGEAIGLPNYNVSVSGTHTITYDEMPSHTHQTDAQYPWELMWYCADGCGGSNPYANLDILPGTGNTSFTGGPGGVKYVGYAGNGAAFSMASTGAATPQAGLTMFEPIVYLNWMIKL